MKTPSLTVRLASVGNPDHGENPMRPLPGLANESVTVATLAEASRVCRRWIETHNLGGGNWVGGEVRDGRTIVAVVGYNGTVWPPGECWRATG